MGCGDLSCQKFVNDATTEYDPKRTAKFFFLGTVLVAPSLHLWYVLGRGGWEGGGGGVVTAIVVGRGRGRGGRRALA